MDRIGTGDGPVLVVGVLGDGDGDEVDDLLALGPVTPLFASGAALQNADPKSWPSFGGHATYPLAVGDVTGDGVPDVAAGGEVFSGAGLSTGEPAVARFIDGAVTVSMAADAGDVNGDGVGDLLAERFGPPGGSADEGSPYNDTALFFGPFSGDIDPLAADAVLPGETVRAGDLDGDGRQDFGAFSTDGNKSLLVFSGGRLTGGATFGAGDADWTITGEALSAQVLAGGDLDGDGHDELWVGHRGADPHLDVFSGADLGGRVFGAGDHTFAIDQAVPPVLADLDGDGALDLILRPTSPEQWELQVYLGGPATDTEPDVVLPTGGATLPMRIGDWDGDGADELMIAESYYGFGGE